MVRWLRWHCPPDTGFEIRALAVWGRARYLSVTEAPRNTDFHAWMGKKHFCFFQTAESGNRTPNPGVKGSGANHYPRAPAHFPTDTIRWINVDLHWSTVYDAGPTLNQQRFSVLCRLFSVGWLQNVKFQLAKKILFSIYSKYNSCTGSEYLIWRCQRWCRW